MLVYIFFGVFRNLSIYIRKIANSFVIYIHLIFCSLNSWNKKFRHFHIFYLVMENDPWRQGYPSSKAMRTLKYALLHLSFYTMLQYT